MADNRSESQTSIRVRPLASLLRHVSAQPQYLPPEIWHLILIVLDDHCFVWFVLRQVSPVLRSVTEDLFARYILRTCSIRFVGQTSLRDLLPLDLQTADDDPRRGNFDAAETSRTRFMSLKPPTFRFQPCSFVPATTKTRLVLKLCDAATQHELVPIYQKRITETVSSNRLAEIFFRPGLTADATRVRLINEPHFVRFNNQLKHIHIPSLTIDVALQEISLDWRQLCDAFLRDEFICRSEANSLGSWSSSLRRNHP